MARRTTIHVDGFSHANPIPAAARVGPLLMSGLINGTDPNGRIGNVPMHKASLWNKYKFRQEPLKGFSVGLGTIYVDERRGNSALRDLPALSSPSYVIYQANVSYERLIARRPWSFTLQGNNLTNKEYFASSAGKGDPFTFSATVRVSFR